VLFHSIDKAVEGVATARASLCERNGVKCNLVNSAIWVGNTHCDEGELRALFSTCGEIDHVRMMMNSHCAFVMYKSIVAAITACCELDGSILAGMRVVVNFKWYHVKNAVDMSRPGQMAVIPSFPVCHVLYVGEIDNWVTRDDLLSIFATYGDVQEIWMPKDGDYAFITFGGVEEAVVAKHHLQGRRLGSKNLRINYRKNVDLKEVLSESVTIKVHPPPSFNLYTNSLYARLYHFCKMKTG
jgi:RNA recognition motif-containing protein